MKGIQNNKFIFQKLSYTYLVYVSERKTLKVFFLARLTCMHQLVTFGELSNDVDTTGTGSMLVVAIRVAISYSCPVWFRNWKLTSYMGKVFGSGTTN
jgi:hypothetical protein